MARISTRKLTPFFEQTEFVNVVIDTPQGAPFKMKLDEGSGMFRLHKALPLGMAFPFNFGFIPSTRGGDGDALDVLLLGAHVFPVGAIVLGKLVAVLQAVQTEKHDRQRNDRLIAIPIDMTSRKPMVPAIELDAGLRESIVAFFVKYNELQRRTFRILGYAGAARALALVRKMRLGMAS